MAQIKIRGGVRAIGNIRFGPVNTPPVWSTSDGSLGSVIEFDTVTSAGFFVVATDADDSPITPVSYTISTGALPTGASLSATGVITGPVVPVGNDTVFTFTVQVTDGLDIAHREFSITVLDNIAPAWSTPSGSLGSRHETETITSGGFTVTATDPDSGPGSLTYSLFSGSLPDGASLNTSNGDITGPAVSVLSDTAFNFTIAASDTDKTTNRAFSITVDNNTVPIWQTSNASPIATVDTGDVVNTSVLATDADAQPMALTYTVTVGSLPTGLSLNSSSGAITGTATVAESPFFTVEADDGLDTASRQFQIVVNQAELSITNSIILDRASSAYIARTPGVAPTSQKVFSISFWFKRGIIGTDHYMVSGGNGTAADHISFGGTPNKIIFEGFTSSTHSRLGTTADFRDPSAWAHILCVAETSNATSTDRLRMYINGTRVIDFSLETYPAQNTNFTGFGNSGEPQEIGRYAFASSSHYDGYMSELNYVDGQALDPTDFGFFDDNGDWQPIAYGGTYGTNGYHLDFEVAPGTGNGAGTDVSGNTNHFTDNNLVAADQVTDTPGTNTNYATFSPLGTVTNAHTYSNGNLTVSRTASGTDAILSTMAVSASDDWYAEFTIDTVPGGSNILQFGILQEDDPNIFAAEPRIGNAVGGYAYTTNWSGTPVPSRQNNGSAVSYGTLGVATDIIGVHLNSGVLTFLHNNVSQGTAFSGLTGNFFFGCSIQATSGTAKVTANFGQKGFAFTPPSSAVALNSSNLPTPAIADPSLHMNTITYNGNGTTGNALTGVGFQPDLVWIKVRSQAGGHRVFDSVRGIENKLATDSLADEVNQSDSLTSFDSDGFTVGAFDTPDGSGFNASGQTYAAWNWKADGTGVANTAGTINSTVSANTTAGFSIVSYNGNDTSGATIGHGLGAVPDMMIVKKRDADGSLGTQGWAVYHSANTSAPETERLLLDTAAATVDDINVWNDTAPTSTLFTVGIDNKLNDFEDYIAYLWSEVEGFSKFGTYDGNGSTDGPFIYCGFRPAYVLIKPFNASAGWNILDAVRDPFNVMNAFLQANTTAAESTASTNNTDFLANGFKPRSTSDHNNGSRSYIFAAFAESPFKTARAR